MTGSTLKSCILALLVGTLFAAPTRGDLASGDSTDFAVDLVVSPDGSTRQGHGESSDAWLDLIAEPTPPDTHWQHGESDSFSLDVTGGSKAERGDSLDFFLNTNENPTGNIIGRVVDPGLQPIEGAAVALRPVNATATSQADGTFSLTTLDVDDGYQLQIIAPGFLVVTRTNEGIAEGVNELGDIVMTPLDGTYSLRSLVPDVNPSMSEVEQGGTAYRYYMVRDVDTGEPTGGVPIVVREAGGGPAVDQYEADHHPGWAGTMLGVSDAGSGVVRIAVPATTVGGIGASQTFEAEASPGQIVTFQVNVVERAYQYAWGQESAGGVGGLINIFGGEVRAKGEIGQQASVVRSFPYSGKCERIESGSSTRVRAGVGVGTPIGGGAQIDDFQSGATAGAEAGVYTELRHEFAYGFDPMDTDASTSALRLYCLHANTPLPEPTLAATVGFVRATIEPLFLDEVWLWSEMGAELGVYGEFNASMGLLGGADSVTVGASFAAEGSREAGVRMLGRYHHTDGSTDLEAGYVTQMSASADVILGMSMAEDNPLSTALGDVGASAHASGAYGAEQFVTLAVPSSASYPSELRLTTRAGGCYSAFVTLGDWTGGVLPEEEETVIETVVAQPILSQAEWDQAASVSGFMNLLMGTGQARFDNAFADELSEVLFADRAFTEDLYYVQSVELMERDEHQAGVSGTFVAGLDIELSLDFIKGRRYILHEGKVRGGKLYPLHVAGPADTIPPNDQSIIDLQVDWALDAAGPLGEAWNRISEFVEDGVAVTVAAVRATGSAALDAAADTFGPGVEIIVDSFDVLPGESLQAKYSYSFEDATINQIYGVGGVYRFSADEPPSGPVTLTFNYLDQNVVGLDEATLRVYRYDEKAGLWELVGGTVDAGLNTVTVEVTELGTFALSPPLPGGKLTLQLSAASVPADGVSTVTATAEDFLLNNGELAGDGWLFDVTASGMDITGADEDATRDGVQVSSLNGDIAVEFQAPATGGAGSFVVRSVLGDASGEGYIAFVDTTAPQQVMGLDVQPGQSRLFVSWDASPISDYVAGYRVYYRQGAAGPPWDGQANVDGIASPVTVLGNSTVLRGLNMNSEYFVTVTALDGSNNESVESTAVSATTVESPPTAPRDVSSEEEAAGKFIVSWTLSKDDGFNDRDVDHYVIYRDTDGHGVYQIAGQVPAGQALYTDTIPGSPVGASVFYEVVAVDSEGLGSAIVPTGVPADLDHDSDVDQDDFGLLQRCLTGFAPILTGCDEADLDADEHVDQGDVMLFMGCMTGPNMPADPACAD